MRNIIISAIAAVSLLGAVTVANAGYFLPGPYVPSCTLIFNGFAWVPFCG